MLETSFDDKGNIAIRGRFDAAQVPAAKDFFERVNETATVDLEGLEYISSAGLGVLLRTHKRLMAEGEDLHLINVTNHINDIFMYSGFDKLFRIDVADPGSGSK